MVEYGLSFYPKRQAGLCYKTCTVVSFKLDCLLYSQSYRFNLTFVSMTRTSVSILALYANVSKVYLSRLNQIYY